jgi:hypothetical protein
MQYEPIEEDRRKLSDRRAKQAAHARMRRRRLKKLGWFCVIIAILAAVWFGVAKAPTLAYFAQQKGAALQTSKGLKRTGKMINRRDIVEKAEQENTKPANAAGTPQ